MPSTIVWCQCDIRMGPRSPTAFYETPCSSLIPIPCTWQLTFSPNNYPSINDSFNSYNFLKFIRCLIFQNIPSSCTLFQTSPFLLDFFCNTVLWSASDIGTNNIQFDRFKFSTFLKVDKCGTILSWLKKLLPNCQTTNDSTLRIKSDHSNQRLVFPECMCEPKISHFLTSFFSEEVWEKINVLSCGFSFIHKHLFFEENRH